jgi:hypothetical protein
MHLIYLQQSGKPVAGASGDFWVQAGVAVPQDSWRDLQVRVNGLQRSFHKEDYDPQKTNIDANALLHPRQAEKRWTRSFCKGLEKIVAGMDLKFFLVIVDKRTTDKPAHPKWLLPLSYGYLLKSICQHLREQDDLGCLIIPPGRPEEQRVLTGLQVENLFGHSGRTSPLISTPMAQPQNQAVGLQVADFVATTARRYHEFIYPKLYNKQTLYGYDALLNSHYQGFVKPNTYQSSANDEKGYRIRGYIYLWRRDSAGRLRDDQASSTEIPIASLQGTRVPNVHS